MPNTSRVHQRRFIAGCAFAATMAAAVACDKTVATTPVPTSFPTYPGCNASNVRTECNSALNQVGKGWFVVGTTSDAKCGPNGEAAPDNVRNMYCYDSQPKGCQPTVCAQFNPTLADWPITRPGQSIYCPSGIDNANLLMRTSDPPAQPLCSGPPIVPSSSLCSALQTREVCSDAQIDSRWLETGLIDNKPGCANGKGRTEVCIASQPLGCQLTVCGVAITPTAPDGWSFVQYEPAGKCIQGQNTAVLLERHNTPAAGANCQ